MFGRVQKRFKSAIGLDVQRSECRLFNHTANVSEIKRSAASNAARGKLFLHGEDGRAYDWPTALQYLS